jgi:putative intracellular protease/amidase
VSLKDPNRVNAKKPKRVALIVANPAVSSTTGWPTGFWWSELAHPYLAFTEKGYEVEIFSPEGGKCEADAMSDPRDPSGYSETDLISMGFLSTPKLAALIETTKPVTALNVADFDAILVAGGQAPMFNFAAAKELQSKFAAFYEAGKVSAAPRCATARPSCATPNSPMANTWPKARPSPVSPISRKTLLTTPCG